MQLLKMLTVYFSASTSHRSALI